MGKHEHEESSPPNVRHIEGTKKGTKRLFNNFSRTILRLGPEFWDSIAMTPDGTRMLSTKSQAEIFLQKHFASVQFNGMQFGLYEHSDPSTFRRFSRAVGKTYDARRKRVDSTEINQAINYLNKLGKNDSKKSVGFEFDLTPA